MSNSDRIFIRAFSEPKESVSSGREREPHEEHQGVTQRGKKIAGRRPQRTRNVVAKPHFMKRPSSLAAVSDESGARQRQAYEPDSYANSPEADARGDGHVRSVMPNKVFYPRDFSPEYRRDRTEFYADDELRDGMPPVRRTNRNPTSEPVARYNEYLEYEQFSVPQTRTKDEFDMDSLRKTASTQYGEPKVERSVTDRGRDFQTAVSEAPKPEVAKAATTTSETEPAEDFFAGVITTLDGSLNNFESPLIEASIGFEHRSFLDAPASELVKDDHPEQEVACVLSGSELNVEREPEPAFSDSTADAWMPAWQVDSFRIPPVCGMIQEQARETLNELSGRLIAATGVGQNVVSVRSLWRGVGRTTMTITLASWLARVGIRTVVIDADFESPDLASQLGVEVDAGWEQDLLGDADAREFCLASAADGFSIVPLSESVDADETVKDRLAEVVNVMSRHYDLVLIDGGPGADVWERRIASRQLGVLAVQDARRRHEDELSILFGGLTRMQLRILGVVGNFEPTR